MQCAAHPQVETGLQCSRCETPICPRCVVQTPVGARCKSCAQLRRAPMYELKPAHYARAAAGGAAVAVAGGIAWTFVALTIPYMGFFLFFLAIGLGWLATRIMEGVAGGKRGPIVQVMAAAGVVGAYMFRNVALAGAPLLMGDLFGLLAVGIAAAVAFTNLR